MASRAPGSLVPSLTPVEEWDKDILRDDEPSVWRVDEIRHYKKWATKDEANSKLESIPEEDRTPVAVSPPPPRREKSHWNHEYLVVRFVSSVDSSAFSYVRIERSTHGSFVEIVRAQVSASDSSASLRQTFPSFPSISPDLAAYDTIAPHNGFDPTKVKDKLISATTFPNKAVSVYAFSLICSEVSNYCKQYLIMRNQCYWYAATVEKMTRVVFEGVQVEEEYFGWKGKLIVLDRGFGPYGAITEEQEAHIRGVYTQKMLQRGKIPRETKKQVQEAREDEARRRKEAERVAEKERKEREAAERRQKEAERVAEKERKGREAAERRQKDAESDAAEKAKVIAALQMELAAARKQSPQSGGSASIGHAIAGQQ